MNHNKLASIALASALLLFAINPSWAGQPKPGTEYKLDEIIVKYRPGKTGISTILNNRFGTQSIGTFSDKNMDRVKLPPGQSVKDAITLFESDPNVMYAEPDYIVHINVTPIRYPTDKSGGL